jgi:phenylpropionate dioxygenase-like ring-hydroxylating dioxygenase large terminal subunit
MLDKRAFTDDAVLADEARRLFGAGFVFAGMTDELANERDFVTLDYPGAAIVVQNFKGQLRAFQNVCAHQFARLQDEPRGNRLLMCRYHGWNYDASGFPFGIPRRSEYKLGDVDRACLSLKPFRVETCGRFVFVCAPDCAFGLRDFLGGFWQTLEELSGHLGREHRFAELPHRANWKLLVENVLDYYHCATLHRETFVADGYCVTGPQDVTVDGPHSSFALPRTPSADEDKEALRRRFLSHLAKRSFQHDSYLHLFVFPNLFVSSTEGRAFFVGQALPVSAGETNLRARYYEPAGLADRHRSRQEMVNRQFSDTGLAIIADEDKPMLESIQRNMAIADGPGFLGEGETRIRAWRGSYERAMTHGLEAALPPAPLSDLEAVA